MKSFKLDMNTLNCVLLIGILVLVIMYYMNKYNENYAPLRLIDEEDFIFDTNQWNFNFKVAPIRAPEADGEQNNQDPCQYVREKTSCNDDSEMPCLWNKKENICDGYLFNKKVKRFKNGPNPGGRYYRRWKRTGECDKRCTSEKKIHEKIKNKALSEIDSNDYCDLKLCRGCCK